MYTAFSYASDGNKASSEFVVKNDELVLEYPLAYV